MIISTAYGPVKGKAENGYYAFLSVPYAAPIVMENRFDAPAPPPKWQIVRDATQLGPVCPQVPTYGPVGRAAASDLSAGEDFLTVNIRTPDPSGRAPVLVWIHGGGYAVGSANEVAIQSGAFAADGIVEVTVNYRLGAMGFLDLPGKPSNRGLLDLIAALQWVQDNIEAFGGDPDRVTLAGRSAGGFAVAAVMAMPAAHGLFSRAMPQSGASTAIATRADAAKLTRRMLDRLGTDMNGLDHVPLPDLLLAQRDLCNESYEHHDYARDGNAAMLGVPFVPVIDEATLPAHPEKAVLAPVPMMIGTTTAEYLTHSTALPAAELTYEDVAALLDERVKACGLAGQDIVERYRAALPQHDARGIWRAVAGDLVFQNPTTCFAVKHAAEQPVWKYLYGSITPGETGDAHGAEVGAVWYRTGMDQSARPERLRYENTDFARKVHRIWVDFIAHGHMDGWQAYDPERPQVLHIDPHRGIAMADDVFAERLSLWQ